jgi:quinoprotein relay system zinc metallohydrolase 2
VLFGGFCLCCLPKITRAASAGPLAVEEVSEGVFMRRGADEDASFANADAIANAGFIVGRDAVLVTDPGGSLTDGERLRAAIAQTTRLPIKYVVMSHVHPDHVFGAAAFLQDNPVFVGHARLRETLEQRGAYYRGKLTSLLGEERAGTIVFPTMEISERAELDLGERSIEATAHAPAHTVCDLSLLDKKTGTLLPADLLFVLRVPSLDGSLRGWRKALDELTKQGSSRAVPGHGPVAVDWPSGSAAITRYLEALERETRAAIAQGLALDAATKTVAASEQDKWKLFGDYNPRNVAEAFRELEWE